MNRKSIKNPLQELEETLKKMSKKNPYDDNLNFIRGNSKKYTGLHKQNAGNLTKSYDKKT